MFKVWLVSMASFQVEEASVTEVGPTEEARGERMTEEATLAPDSDTSMEAVAVVEKEE